MPFSPRQRGVVLVLGMFFLLVVTVLGLVAMRTATLENMMAANNQFGIEALSNAELVLTAAEVDIEAQTQDNATLDWEAPDDAYHQYGEIDARQSDWGDKDNGGFDHTEVPGVGKYAIEYAGQTPLPGETVDFAAGASGSYVYIFIMAIRAESAKGAVRTLQSIYVTRNAP